MIIEFGEGVLELKESLSKTFGVFPEYLESPEGKLLLIELIAVYIRRSFYTYITNEPLSEAALMSEFGSLLFKAGQHTAYTAVKTEADLLIRYEAADDTEHFDDKPEGKAYYEVCEFLEEAFRTVEETLMTIINHESPESREMIYQFRIPTGNAASAMVVGEAIINKSSVVRSACGSRKQYIDIIRSIVLG